MNNLIWTAKQADAQKDASSQWVVLDEAIDLILRGKSSSLSFERLHSIVYDLVMQREGVFLRSRTKEKLANFCASLRKDITVENDVVELVAAFKNYSQSVKLLAGIYMYYNNNYCKPSKCPTLLSDAREAFRLEILEANDGLIRQKAIDLLLDTIRTKRSNELPPSLRRLALTDERMAELIQFFVEVSYDNNAALMSSLIEPIVRDSDEFYCAEAARLRSLNNGIDILGQTYQRYTDEQNVQLHSITPAVKRHIMPLFISRYVDGLGSMLLQCPVGGFDHLFRNDIRKSLGRLYTLMSLSPTQSIAFAAAFRASISAAFSGEPQQSRSEKALSILQIWNRAREICESPAGFNSDTQLMKQITAAVENVYAADRNFSSCLADRIDTLVREFRTGLRDFDSIISETSLLIAILQPLSDRELFESCCRKNFTLRMLKAIGFPRLSRLDSNALVKAEERIIELFRESYGDLYPQKMELLKSEITDVGNQETLFSPLTPVVISSLYWSLSRPSGTPFAPDLAALLPSYEERYSQRLRGRCLKWHHCLGYGELFYYVGASSTPACVILCSTAQMNLLCWFNSRKSYSFEELVDLLGSSSLTKKTLQSIVSAAPLLLAQNEFRGSQRISIRDDFSPEKLVLQLIDEQDSGDMQTVPAADIEPAYDDAETCSLDRQIIDAEIVKLMKARQGMVHSELVSEATDRLRHRPGVSAAIVRDRIESLMQREYLKSSIRDKHVVYYVP